MFEEAHIGVFPINPQDADFVAEPAFPAGFVVFVGDDDDEVVPFGDVVEEGDVEGAKVVGDDDVVAFPLGDDFTGDGDAGSEFKKEVNEKKDEFAGHRFIEGVIECKLILSFS